MHEPKHQTKNSEGSIPMLVGKSVCTNRCWGCREETAGKPHLAQPTSITIMTINIFTCFAETTILTQRWNLQHYHNYPHLRHSFCRERPCYLTMKLWLNRRSNGQLLERSQSGFRRSLENTSRERSPRREPPSHRHMSTSNWRGMEIIVNMKGP
jgi:hypothetical protein